MNKNLKLILSTSTFFALPVFAISCQKESKNNPKSLSELSKIINNLSNDEKVQLVSRLKISTDDKAKLIQQFNQGAGIASSIIWYMKSAEQRTASLQAYTLATQAFDNLKKKNTEGFDYSKVNKETGVVSNPESTKAIPVVFMDLDETVFINEYAEAYGVVKNNGVFSSSEKEKTDAEGKRKAVPGAIKFIQHVFDNGGIVLFNSNIDQKQHVIEGIKKNLEGAGLPKKYIHDWMFWCRGVVPTDAEGKFSDKTPWLTAFEAYKQNKKTQKVSKNKRMNAVTDNIDGWDFSKSQQGAGNKVVGKVIMKIGDDYSDFFDDAYKPLENNSKTVEFSKKPEIETLFTNINGADGVKVTGEGERAKIEKLNWAQFNVQIPGNGMYGSWSKEYNNAQYMELWEALKEIIEKK
ncbi:lipoprotein, acid phosphatase [Mycoplasmopsis californica]|uniref:Lipoprotein, acid phosphatase n=1 Tax=Mycoplasmopsis californica TaxID=2113 RepID=A0A059XVE3_9BACT|nr:HAD family acid phosphatase [Mycoplasmopsis californica]AIA29222.1 lipoprotein, acid phosphatase [Mycoplasmopsis californica]